MQSVEASQGCTSNDFKGGMELLYLDVRFPAVLLPLYRMNFVRLVQPVMLLLHCLCFLHALNSLCLMLRSAHSRHAEHVPTSAFFWSGESLVYPGLQLVDTHGVL